MSVEGLYRYLGTIVEMIERQARAVETNGQRQSATTRGSSFDDFKRQGPSLFFWYIGPNRGGGLDNENREIF